MGYVADYKDKFKQLIEIQEKYGIDSEESKKIEEIYYKLLNNK